MGGKRREAEEQAKADQAELEATMAEAAGATDAYRPHTQQALNNVLQQQLSAFTGTNSLLEQMGLTGFGDGEQYGNIVGKDMMEVGTPSKGPGFEEAKPVSDERTTDKDFERAEGRGRGRGRGGQGR